MNMNNYPQTDPWCIIEESFQPDKQIESESIFSLGNGYISQRANFEEYYSGETIIGSYISGAYYNDSDQNKAIQNEILNYSNGIIKTPNCIGIIIRLNDEILDLETWDVQDFKRVLNMHEGFLERTFEAISTNNHRVLVSVKRFLSMSETEIGAISYSVKSLNFEGRISFMPIISADIQGTSLDDNQQLWNVLQIQTQQDVSHLWAQTRRIDFHFCAGLCYVLYKNNEQLKVNPIKIEKEKIAGFSVGVDVRIGDTICLNKYFSIIDSLNHPQESLPEKACLLAINAKKKGWNKLFEEHSAVWAEKWLTMDVLINESIEAQQAIRHKIFSSILNLEVERVKA